MNYLCITILLYCYIAVYVCDDDIKVDVDAYCELRCPEGKKHTICEYKCELAPECSNFKHTPLTDKERQFMLDAHNYKRNLVASGQDTRGGNSRAKNMLVLNYDKDIEVATYCWGKRCKFGHDSCRYTLKYDSAGQNLHLAQSNRPLNPSGFSHLNQSVVGWYEEIEYTTRKIMQQFDKTEEPTGHFTQMIWHTTKFIGCSIVTFDNPKDPTSRAKYWLHILCNYSPAGNILGLPVYEPGRGCTGILKPNEHYRALCGKITIISPERDPSVSEGAADGVGKIEIDLVILIFTLVTLLFL